MRELLVISKLYLQLILATDVLNLNVCVQRHTKRSSCAPEGRRKRLSLAHYSLFIDRKEWGKVFCLTDRQLLVNNLLGELHTSLGARHSKDCPSVAGSYQTVLNELLNLFRKIKES